MISERHEHLIQDALAGEATAAQTAELEALLAADAGMRTRHEELRGVFAALVESPASAPPPGLHDDIMRAIRLEQAPVSLARRPRWKLLPILGAFIGGAATAVLVLVPALRSSGTGHAIDGAQSSGTMAPVATAHDATVSKQTIAAGGGQIESQVLRSGALIQVEIHVRCDRPVALEVTYPHDALGLTGMRWPNAALPPLALNTGRVAINAANSGNFVLEFATGTAADAPLLVRVAGAGEVTLHTVPQ